MLNRLIKLYTSLATKGVIMARVNKKLLRKAKSQLKTAAKAGNEQASEILNRRKSRTVERTGEDFETRRQTTNVNWNFESGELVCFKRGRGARYNCQDTDCYLVIGTTDRSYSGRSYIHEEKNSNLEVTGPNGIIVVRAADVKKL